MNPQSLELMRVLSASKAEVFWKLRVPSSLPFLFSALKIASTTSVLGAIVGEWIGADLGLGALIIEATHNFRSPLLYATVFVSSAWAGRLLRRWSASPSGAVVTLEAGRGVVMAAPTADGRRGDPLDRRSSTGATCSWSAAVRPASAPRSPRRGAVPGSR